MVKLGELKITLGNVSWPGLPKRCENCRFWNGTESNDMADCTNPGTVNSRSAFNSSCTLYVQKGHKTPEEIQEELNAAISISFSNFMKP